MNPFFANPLVQRLGRLCYFGTLVWSLPATAESSRRLYVDLSPTPDPAHLAAFDFCVVQANAHIDLEAGHALGGQYLARLDVVEAIPHSTTAIAAERAGVPLLRDPKSTKLRMDVTHPGWKVVVDRYLAEDAAVRGFDGFVFKGLERAQTDRERRAVMELLQALNSRFPDKQIVIEGALSLAAEARLLIDGVLCLGVTQRVDTNYGSTTPRTNAEVKLLEHKLREITRQGVKAYAVDFADTAAMARASRLAARLEELGCLCFITTPALKGINLGPWTEPSRRIVVVHGGTAAEGTLSARWLHGPLQWLGCKLEYWDITAKDLASLARLTPDDCAGVIVDATLMLPDERELPTARAIAALRRNRVPLLLTGLPWKQRAAWDVTASALGLHGSGVVLNGVQDVRLNRIDSALQQETTGRIITSGAGFRDLRSPGSAKVVLSLQGRMLTGIGCQFDQAFLTDWGGVWIEPLAMSAGLQMDPLGLLGRWLGARFSMPVPDATVQEGRRILVTQVSSEGFADVSQTRGLPTCAEALRDRILARYPLPMTVAVCEAEVRGWQEGQDARDAMQLTEVARSIFAIPCVEAASGSFSRPARWSSGNFHPGELRKGIPQTKHSLNREITGSMAFIQQNLLPHGKDVMAMIWPADHHLPAGEALALCSDLGVPTLGAFQAPASALLPGQAQAWRPQGWMAEAGHMATFPVRVNRALMNATEALDARCAPVHLALSFKDARDEAALAAVETTVEQCLREPLHAMSAGDYARLVRDAATTRMFRRSPDEWLVVNDGHVRTLRLPVEAGVPDLAASRGVSGYARHGGLLYVHTTGRRCTRLVLTAAAEQDRLYLVASSAQVRFLEIANRRALFEVRDWRPVEMIFGGMIPGSVCTVTANGRASTAPVDARGRAGFTVPSRALVQLQISSPAYAALR